MMKRIIALLLALILTVGLLPTVALAAEGDEETTANPITNPELQTANGVTLSKTAAKNDDGTYTIRLEAYARGSSTTTETTEEVPTDIILVLDRSGSMGENKMGKTEYNKYTGSSRRNEKLYSNKDNLFYKLTDGSYVKVEVKKEEQTVYSPYRVGTTNGDYYDDSHGWGAVTLYAQISETNYQKVTVSRKLANWWHFYTYTLENGIKIASDSKGNDTVPEFKGVASPVLYTKSTRNVYTYTYTDADGKPQTIGTSTGDRTEFTAAVLYAQRVNSNGGETRMEALKNAASNFVDSVEKKATGTGGKTVAHRIAVVSFASDATNDTNGFKDMTKSSDVNSVKSTISNLTAKGGTLVDKGIETANEIFKENPLSGTPKRNRVMIVFTDGAPGSSGNWKSASVETANSAIRAANTTKNTYHATVFTIGIFAGAKNDLPIPVYTKYTIEHDIFGNYEVSPSDADQTKNSNRFMHLVSTNYPSATDIENPGAQNKNTGYYLTASDSASLNNVFQQISNQIQDVKTTDLDGSAKVEDVVGTNFTFAGTAASDVTIKTAPFVSETNAQYTFGTEETASATVTATVDNGKISVTGFSFKENWCGYNKAGDTQTPHGKKLIIEFKVSENTTGCDTASIPTNNGNAKILDKDGKPAVEIGSPTVQGYRVAYDDGVDDNTVANMPEPSNYFITSTTVASETPTRAGYTFAGWKAAGSDTPYNAGATIMFNGQDVELIAQWTPKMQQVDLGIFVKKQFNMTEENELANPGETFTVTVKQTKPVVESAPEYTGAVTFTKGGEEYFTFAGNKPTLTYGVDYEFSVVEKAGQNTNITYDSETHTLRLKLKEVTDKDGNKQIVADGNTVTIQNGYTETYTLTYDANGGIAPVPTTSIGHKTGDSVTLNYTTDQPTHAQVSDGNVYLIGWSLTDTNKKVYTRNERASLPMLADSVTFADRNITVYAVWAVDENGNDMPDVYDAEATYKIVGGKWADNTTNDKIEYVPLYAKNSTTGKWTEIENPVLVRIPTGMTPDDTHKEPGAWDSNTNPAFVKGGTNVFTYTYTTKGKFSVIYTWTGLPADDKFAEGTKLTPPSRAEVTEGGSHDVDQTYTSTSTVTDVDGNTYKFSGWSSATEGVDIDENGKINGIQTNVTLTGTWTKLGSGTFDLNDKIFKVFDEADGSRDIPRSSYTFEVKVTRLDKETNELTDEKYTGTVTLDGATAAATPSFVFHNPITFHIGGEYRFLVEEKSNTVTALSSDERIDYDNAEYYLYVTVSDDLKTINYRFDPVVAITSAEEESAAAENRPITFYNYYYAAKDPGTYPIDFSTLIFKVLTKTGDRSFNGAEFTASVDGWKVNQYDVMSMRVIKTHFVDLQPVTLKATFPANTTFDADGKAYRGFTGDTLTVTAGRYLFLIDEINDGQMNITYDESKYWLDLGFVENAEGEVSLAGQRVRKFVDGDTYETVLALKDSEWMIVDTSISPVYFENTIDTGKDDYYPIIIPTIINKDTGMLNKTDHFAYVIGYPDGTVHPNGQITRAEVATIFFRLLKDEVRDGAFTTSNSYSDVAYGKWYNNPISTMSALGIITGYPDGTFKPNKPITRAEFAAIAARFDETQSGKSATFSDVIGHWAAKEIGIAYANEWIKGYPDGTFKPDQNITRAEAMTMINRVLERKPESPADLLTNMNKWTDNMDTSKWYYLDVQEATNSHGYTRKTFNYELWRQMLNDPDWSRYER